MRAVGLLAVIVPLIAADDPPKFEAASVKRADRCSMENPVDPGMIRFNGDPLRVVLGEAFKVPMDRIIGPSWLDEDCFAVTAKMPEGATRDQLPAMLEALLVERFKLAAHKESRPTPGYALVLDKKGPKFKESDSHAASARAGVTFGVAVGMIRGHMTMASLARYLSRRLNGPVQDLTGLQGTYDIDVTWTPDRAFEPPGQYAQNIGAAHAGPVDAQASLPTTDIFSAFRDTLGLKLEPRKDHVEVVVIDHIERVPLAN